MIKRPRFVAVAYTLSGIGVALAVSWLILVAVNFSYGFWHDYGGVGEAIDRYGPENKFRSGFHLTSKAERETLFAGIVDAIHGDSDMLQTLSYRVTGYPEQTLLTEPEVVHLQDVARLLNVGAWAAGGALLMWLAAVAWYLFRQQPFPSFRTQFVGVVLGLTLVGILVWIVGPVKIFYLLHTWVFPEGHAWFFYYQESLMSTMMYAPVLFGWIALEWLALTLIVYVVLQYGIARAGGLLMQLSKK